MTKIKQILIHILKFFLISCIFVVLVTLLVPYFSDSCKVNSNIKKFDVIIVLGSPAIDNCEAGSIMKDRVAKGIELLKLGIGKKILFTGSSVRNNCTEAEVMEAYAIFKGISKRNILTETKAANTFPNPFYSGGTLKQLIFKSTANCPL